MNSSHGVLTLWMCMDSFHVDLPLLAPVGESQAAYMTSVFEGT